MVDASLATVGRITGAITNDSGTGIAEVDVTAYRWNETSLSWDHVEYSRTDSMGINSIGGLVPGTYRVGAYDPSGTYDGTFHTNAPDVDSADDVFVVADTTTSGIHIMLPTAASGTITGTITVTPLAGLIGIHATLSSSLAGTVDPAMTGFHQTGPGTFEANFEGQPGHMYQLEHSASMLPGSWINDGAPFEAHSGGDVLSMNSTEPKMFWCVREL